jgi:hypothetical protein
MRSLLVTVTVSSQLPAMAYLLVAVGLVYAATIGWFLPLSSAQSCEAWAWHLSEIVGRNKCSVNRNSDPQTARCGVGPGRHVHGSGLPPHAVRATQVTPGDNAGWMGHRQILGLNQKFSVTSACGGMSWPDTGRIACGTACSDFGPP